MPLERREDGNTSPNRTHGLYQPPMVEEVRDVEPEEIEDVVR
jgi:hypothetical protein